MASAQYNKMLNDRILNVSSDTRPWGGISPIFDLDARVESISRNMGAAFDTCTLTFPEEDFGDEQTYFLPMRVTDNATSAVLYRGFITVNEGNINASTEQMKTVCLCYKWMLSKRTILRGKWYLNKGEISGPVGGMGSGTSAGDTKYTYERFRSDLQEGSGYLQNEQLVFNQGGAPDCFQDNLTTGTTLAFYKDTVDIDETAGIPDSQFAAKSYPGYYWTWCTIIRYIHEYFIDPYNVILAPINLNNTDLTALKNIDEEIRRPMNYSIEGYNPAAAIDYVVSSIPGRWYWYLEYTSTTTTIRIKELDDPPGNDVDLTLCNFGDKLVNSDANVTSINVKRDAAAAVANVVGLGGKVKLVCTIKLVPTWPRYNGNTTDFKDAADFTKWKQWAEREYNLEKKNQNKEDLKISQKDLMRYRQIYRQYGVPREGELFSSRIVSADPGTPPPDTIELDGEVGTHYTAFTIPGGGGGATLRDYYFRNAAIEREIAPPEFERFADRVQVFMYDSLFDILLVTDSSGNTLQKIPKGTTGVAADPAQNAAVKDRSSWIIPDKEKISYNFDQKNMEVVFDQPQPKQKNAFTLKNNEKLQKTLKEQTFSQISSRDVYMTATFTTDIAATFGSVISGGFIETINGAPFSAYVQARNQDIVYHQNAWYPITAEEKDVDDPTNSTDTCDGHKVGDAIRQCDSFDNYRKYIGEGHYELARAILAWKEGYLNYREDVSAQLPYMEIDYSLGDGLTTIANSDYVGIASQLMSISWQRVGDSDSMTTQLVFNNYYSTNRTNIDFAPLKLNEKKMRFNKRQSYFFNNEVPSGDLPTL
jgi:hypothetical protein